MYTYCKIKDHSQTKWFIQTNFFFWYVKQYFKFKRERDSQMRAGEKLTLIWELTTTFDTFWNICVALKRAVFCKHCYCCLMPVIFACNSGCWSFSAKYLSDLCRDLSGKTCFNFGCWFPDLSVSQTSIFFHILCYFCHSRQLP
jgi:hypothetical protein